MGKMAAEAVSLRSDARSIQLQAYHTRLARLYFLARHFSDLTMKDIYDML
jgi:hypothetical protein